MTALGDARRRFARRETAARRRANWWSGVAHVLPGRRPRHWAMARSVIARAEGLAAAALLDQAEGRGWT